MTAEATPEMDTRTYVRFAHFAPGVDGFDIFVDDSLIDETNLIYPVDGR